MSKPKNIAILGAGNLGMAIARGIVREKLAKPADITLTRRKANALGDISQEGFSTDSSNVEAVRRSELILLCVQPKQLPDAIGEIRDSLKPEHVLVSVITGVSIKQITEEIGKPIQVIRAMPNTAIAIGQSMTCISASNGDNTHMPFVESIFRSLGETMVIEERLMQAATVLGASGIAFFMRYLRAATQGGIQMGFHPEEAQKIAVQTAKGAASLIISGGNHPEVEIDKVTTPQGCTIEGLNEMEHEGFSSALIKGLMTSFQKINSIS